MPTGIGRTINEDTDDEFTVYEFYDRGRRWIEDEDGNVLCKNWDDGDTNNDKGET